MGFETACRLFDLSSGILVQDAALNVDELSPTRPARLGQLDCSVGERTEERPEGQTVDNCCGRVKHRRFRIRRRTRQIMTAAA
jgi:hypothetical protein